MGKFTDLVLGIIVLVIGIWFLTKLHLTAGQIWNMVWKFFSSSGSGTPTNATSVLLGMGMTNSKAREKLKNHIIAMKRRIAERTYRREEQEARRRFSRD